MQEWRHLGLSSILVLVSFKSLPWDPQLPSVEYLQIPRSQCQDLYSRKSNAFFDHLDFTKRRHLIANVHHKQDYRQSRGEDESEPLMLQKHPELASLEGPSYSTGFITMPQKDAGLKTKAQRLEFSAPKRKTFISHHAFRLEQIRS